VDAIALIKYGRIMCYARNLSPHHQKSTTTTINSSSHAAGSGSGSHTIDGAKTGILASSRLAPKVTTWGAKSKK